jgi:ATP-dependent RNA helicase DeaD
MLSFNDFNLQPATQALLADMKITEPTPIQDKAIPALLAGNDFVGQAPTGSGKTLAYGLPLVERVARDKRVAQLLILVPTRELAVQVHSVLGRLATSRKLSTAVLVGGRAYGPQISALHYGAQIVVGTPGRVKDHLDRGTLVLDQLRMCVLDEADQMLDSGFAPDIEEILTTTPETRQMALFSATIPDWVEKLEQKFLKNPIKVGITPAAGGLINIEQIAYQVPQDQKMAALCTLLRSSEGESSLIFGKTKYGVEKLGKQLNRLGFTVGTLHGNKSQHAREEVLTAFRRGQVQTLLATNVAARGLDIKDIYQVINYELPESSDLFTHRIGRTGRMGKQGKAITLLAPSDVSKWRSMSRNLGQKVALQKLAIDDQATEFLPLAEPEASLTPEFERKQDGEQQVTRERKQFSQRQDRSSFARPGLESYTESQERGSFARPQRDSYRESQGRNSSSGPRRVSYTESQERNSFSRPRRDSFTESQERNNFSRPKRERFSESNPKKRQNEYVSSETPAWQAESYPSSERPYSGNSRVRDDRRGSGKPFRSARSTDRRNTPAFEGAEPLRRNARKKLRLASASPSRRASATKRAASR